MSDRWPAVSNASTRCAARWTIPYCRSDKKSGTGPYAAGGGRTERSSSTGSCGSCCTTAGNVTCNRSALMYLDLYRKAASASAPAGWRRPYPVAPETERQRLNDLIASANEREGRTAKLSVKPDIARRVRLRDGLGAAGRQRCDAAAQHQASSSSKRTSGLSECQWPEMLT